MYSVTIMACLTEKKFKNIIIIQIKLYISIQLNRRSDLSFILTFGDDAFEPDDVWV